MSRTVVVTSRIPEETSAALDALAEKMERSRAWIVAKAVERYVKEETDFLAFVQVGLDDLDAGRSITHEELVRRIGLRRQARKAA